MFGLYAMKEDEADLVKKACSNAPKKSRVFLFVSRRKEEIERMRWDDGRSYLVGVEGFQSRRRGFDRPTTAERRLHFIRTGFVHPGPARNSPITPGDVGSSTCEWLTAMEETAKSAWHGVTRTVALHSHGSAEDSTSPCSPSAAPMEIALAGCMTY